MIKISTQPLWLNLSPFSETATYNSILLIDVSGNYLHISTYVCIVTSWFFNYYLSIIYQVLSIAPSLWKISFFPFHLYSSPHTTYIMFLIHPPSPSSNYRCYNFGNIESLSISLWPGNNTESCNKLWLLFLSCIICPHMEFILVYFFFSFVTVFYSISKSSCQICPLSTFIHIRYSIHFMRNSLLVPSHLP